MILFLRANDTTGRPVPLSSRTNDSVRAWVPRSCPRPSANLALPPWGPRPSAATYESTLTIIRSVSYLLLPKNARWRGRISKFNHAINSHCNVLSQSKLPSTALAWCRGFFSPWPGPAPFSLLSRPGPASCCPALVSRPGVVPCPGVVPFSLLCAYAWCRAFLLAWSGALFLAVAPCCRALVSCPAVALWCRALVPCPGVVPCCRALLSRSAIALRAPLGWGPGYRFPRYPRWGPGHQRTRTSRP